MTTAVADYEPGERISGVRDEVFVTPAPARLHRPDGTVIVHVLRPLSSDAFRLLRPIIEAFASVRSPHVGGLIEAGYQADGEPPFAWYVTEDHGRGDLRGQRDRRRVLLAVAAAARGVHALHQAGLTHHGVSPTTVRPTSGGAVIDPPAFRAGSGDEGRILDIVDAGVLDSVDPAVARGDPPSRASDLWSLGATLHQAITGRLLHPDLPGDEPIVALQRTAFEPIRMADDLEPALAAVVASCLAPDPSDRPPTAAALADHLQTLVPQQ
ncbi:MAG: hypothetical protein M3Y91_01545 [Actinomycetota bacterium]|nr:hypothetical protein [Actinomycetota bacterium]